MLNLLSIITLITTLAYGLLVLWQWWGWQKILKHAKSQSLPPQPYSAIIAARNEQGKIGKLISDILNQTHKPEAIIVVNDHSTDATGIEIQALASHHPSIVHIDLVDGMGKKAALARGIAEAKTELILCTDADCRVGSNWASQMIEYQQKSNYSMVLGPVILSGDQRLFSRIQALEMNAIMGVTGGMAAHNHPVMANGANLLFKKSIFEKLGGHGGQPNNPSGDDVFLMLNIHKNRPGSVGFCPHFEAVVATEAKNELTEFLEQRKRWLSKKGGYSNAWVVGVALITYLGNLAALISLFLLSIKPELACWALVIKFIPDLVLVRSVQKQLQPQCGIGLIMLAELFIILYVTLIGLVPTNRYVWKNREVAVTS